MNANETMTGNRIDETRKASRQALMPLKWIRTRYGVAVGGIALAGAGLALGWDWLAAIGALPLLLSLLPCAAMCALGLCMMRHHVRPQGGAPTPEKDG